MYSIDTKFRNHLIILLIKEKVNNLGNTFSLEAIEVNEVNKEIRSLNSKKTGTDKEIPAKILKNCKDS